MIANKANNIDDFGRDRDSYEIEFLEEEHLYLIDGILVPNVSTILNATIFKNKYSNVKPEVLKKAGEHGSNVHKAIETNFYKTLNDNEYRGYRTYIDITRDYKIQVIEHERMVNYGYVYCGTLDLEAHLRLDNSFGLGDVKTTYNIDIEYLSWQLSMYARASGKDYDKLFAIWIPKRGGGGYYEIPRKTNEEIDDLLSLYYKNKGE